MTLRIRRRLSGATFIHPMDLTQRTAILTPGFQETKLVRVFADGWNEEAARFNPSSIAATTEQLRGLCKLRLTLSHPLIAFTYAGDRALTDDDRDLFWDSFGLPTYEQHLGPDNELLAMECEVHAGLHVTGNFDHLPLISNYCPCGNPAPRQPQ